VLYRGGREVARQIGAMSANDLLRWLREQLPVTHRTHT
jgi:hypothetical protein